MTDQKVDEKREGKSYPLFRKWVSESMTAGYHQVVWDPGEIPADCYLVVLRTEEETLTRTCVRTR